MRLRAVISAACATLVLCAFANGAWAQPRSGSREDTLDNLVRRMQICSETGQATPRLACYDGIAASMGGTPATGTTAPLVAPMPPVAGTPAPYVGNATQPNDPDRAYNPRDPNDQRGGVAADPYPRPPHPQVRRSGPGPLPGGYGQMPIVTLETSQFGYNDQRYWQVTIDVANNIGRLIDSEVQCTFTNNSRPVKDTYFTATAIQPGEHVSTEVLGPPTTTFVDGVTCRVLSPLR